MIETVTVLFTADGSAVFQPDNGDYYGFIGYHVESEEVILRLTREFFEDGDNTTYIGNDLPPGGVSSTRIYGMDDLGEIYTVEDV